MNVLRKLLTGLVWLSQLVAGLTFLASSLAKANDPLGMTILLQDYLGLMDVHTVYASVPVTSMAVVLALVEAAMGIGLLIGCCRRRTTTAMLAFMVPMLLITGYNAATGAVPECGCFGSALHMTNGQSFMKNIVLTAIAVLLYWRREAMYQLPGRQVRAWVANVVVVLVAVLGIWSWRHLPPVDFTPYKTGTDVMAAMMGEYDVVDGKSVEIAAPTIKDFALTDAEGNDLTDDILMAEQEVTLITIPSEERADTGNSDRLNSLWDEACDKGRPFYLVMAEDKAAAEHFKDRTGLNCPVLFASQEMLQTIVRANPGIVRLKGGVIKEKLSLKHL